MPVGSRLSLSYRSAGAAFDHRAMIDLYEPDQLFSPKLSDRNSRS
jgi:hypothetical protein